MTTNSSQFNVTTGLLPKECIPSQLHYSKWFALEACVVVALTIILATILITVNYIHQRLDPVKLNTTIKEARSQARNPSAAAKDSNALVKALLNLSEYKDYRSESSDGFEFESRRTLETEYHSPEDSESSWKTAASKIVKQHVPPVLPPRKQSMENTIGVVRKVNAVINYMSKAVRAQTEPTDSEISRTRSDLSRQSSIDHINPLRAIRKVVSKARSSLQPPEIEDRKSSHHHSDSHSQPNEVKHLSRFSKLRKTVTNIIGGKKHIEDIPESSIKTFSSSDTPESSDSPPTVHRKRHHKDKHRHKRKSKHSKRHSKRHH